LADARREQGDRGGPDSIARNTAFSFAAQMTTAALTAVLTLFLVRELGPEGYGLFALAMSIGGIVLIAADFGISQATARFTAERRDSAERVAVLYVDALKLKFAATGAVCLLMALLAGPIANAYGDPDLVWPIRGIALATFAQSLMLMGDGVFTALGKVVIRLRVTAIESFTEVLASMALVLVGAGAAGAAFGRAIGYIVGAALGVVTALAVVGRPKLHLLRPPRRDTVRHVGRYASSLMVVDASYVFSGNANVLFLGAYMDSAAAGIYRAPSRLVALLHYPGLSLAYGIAPRVSRREGHEPDVNALQRGLRGIILLQAAVLGPIIVWTEPIVDLLLGPGYERAVEVMRIQAPYIFFVGLAPLLSLSINYLGEARRRIPIAVTTLVLTVLGAVTLIPAFGLAGAAIGTDIAYGFYVFGHLWLCRRALGLAVAPLARALGCALAAAAAMGLVLFQFGTDDLSVLQWVGGLAGGLAAYVGVLFLTRQIRRRDVAALAARIRALRARPARV
jgi:O-antigen/teichoic acid export membrane protein